MPFLDPMPFGQARLTSVEWQHYLWISPEGTVIDQESSQKSISGLVPHYQGVCQLLKAASWRALVPSLHHSHHCLRRWSKDSTGTLFFTKPLSLSSTHPLSKRTPSKLHLGNYLQQDRTMIKETLDLLAVTLSWRSGVADWREHFTHS